jgi:hypothetical protein
VLRTALSIVMTLSFRKYASVVEECVRDCVALDRELFSSVRLLQRSSGPVGPLYLNRRTQHYESALRYALC